MHRSRTAACEARADTTLDCRAWTSASAISRRIRASRPARSRASSRSAARSRCSSPSTRTSPPAARAPYPRGGDLPVEVLALLRPVRRADRRRGGHDAPARRQRHLPGHRARPDHHRQGGRERRPPLRRAPEFGVGAGWNREEMANHGTDPRTRMALMRERVEAMKAIWTQDGGQLRRRRTSPSSGSGPSPSRAAPASADPRRRRRARACSTACSRSATRGCPTTTRDRCERIAELRARARAARSRSTPSCPPTRASSSARWQAGVRRAIHWLPSGGRSIVEPALERWEAAIAELVGV